GVDFADGKRDLAPQISFSFSQPREIAGLQVWNYCEANLAKRGVKNFEIPGVGEFELKLGDGGTQIIEFAKPTRLAANQALTFVVKSNWNNISYPLPETFKGDTSAANDNAFVGLAEVKFLTRDADGKLTPIDEVPQVVASSELTARSHNRLAKYAADGSGMDVVSRGWAAQGRPFYSGAVDYSFSLKNDELPTNEQILFALPGLRDKWNGAVAVILVNGTKVGSIAYVDETVDLTDAIAAARKDGATEFEITTRVYGTPKNQLGPHHAGRLRGSAWPGSFHSAPASQPSGSAYDVIEYGFFVN
ncbi:MAG: hypothetical protein HUK22_08355, partial [Thermoguttaceae bacterium]|nr:hypothetical protein [Thermoguttaceae bacterium]